MRWSGEVKGVLGVGTRDAARRLTRAEGELLEAFANLAALALTFVVCTALSARLFRWE